MTVHMKKSGTPLYEEHTCEWLAGAVFHLTALGTGSCWYMYWLTDKGGEGSGVHYYIIRNTCAPPGITLLLCEEAPLVKREGFKHVLNPPQRGVPRLPIGPTDLS